MSVSSTPLETVAQPPRPSPAHAASPRVANVLAISCLRKSYPTPEGDTQVGSPAAGTLADPEGPSTDEGSPREIEKQEHEEERPPFAGHAGGAVGGFPAQRRSSGGHVGRGIRPGVSGVSVFGAPRNARVGNPIAASGCVAAGRFGRFERFSL